MLKSYCVCGHEELMHHLGGGCRQCWTTTTNGFVIFSQRMKIAAHEFKRDNLKYLEEVANGR